jgi:RNA polymerase sigma-70 factor (ECF subfamily)
MSNVPNPSPPTETDALIERCLRAIRTAWEQIVRSTGARSSTSPTSSSAATTRPRISTQDIFLKIFKALHTFDRRANFQTWLISISRNLCIDHYRSVRKERETMARDVDASC